MQFETLYDGKQIPRLGLGTWKMGGDNSADYSRDAETIQAIRSALELGYTHIDTAEMYSAGHTEELVGQAIHGFNRQDLFIASKVWPSHLHYTDVLNALAGSLKRLGTDYLDLYLIHWPNWEIPLEETFRALNELGDRGQVRYVGVSNFDLRRLRQAQAFSSLPIATNQVPYSLYHREYAINGVLDYCQGRNILLTAYSPVDQGAVLADPEVNLIARKYGATPAQIALSWLFRQPKVITIPMSLNPRHLKENIEALDLQLSEEDMERLNQLGG